MESGRGPEITFRLSKFMCMYDIDRFTGFTRIQLVLAVWEHLPEANLHL